MPHHDTSDFADLLDKQNVVGVNYDAEADRVDVWVSQKLGPQELSPQDNVTNPDNLPDWFEGDVNVEDAGYGDDRDGFDPAVMAADDAPVRGATPDADHTPQASPRRDRHRPVESGLSEINGASTAATGGVLARVRDPSSGRWSDAIDADDFVRVSNHHVYANTMNDTPVDGSDTILQPSPYDGGTSDDAVGTPVAFAPLEDGGTVDAAARSVDLAREAHTHYGLDGVGSGVRRSDYAELTGESVIKGGRTTGETTATVKATDAMIRVRYGGDVGTVTFAHQIVTSKLSEGGDSGSPVFHAETGALIGHLFAGSADATIINKAKHIEQALGIELMPDETTTLDTDVAVQMTEPTLSLVQADPLSEPAPGEEVTIRATVSSNYREDVFVQAVGPENQSRVDVVGDSLDETDDGAYQTTVELTVTAPPAFANDFTVTLKGGHTYD